VAYATEKAEEMEPLCLGGRWSGIQPINQICNDAKRRPLPVRHLRYFVARTRFAMEMILIVVIVLLLLGGGGYWGRTRGHW
jgi:hypothetical protein